MSLLLFCYLFILLIDYSVEAGAAAVESGAVDTVAAHQWGVQVAHETVIVFSMKQVTQRQTINDNYYYFIQ